MINQVLAVVNLVFIFTGCKPVIDQDMYQINLNKNVAFYMYKDSLFTDRNTGIVYYKNDLFSGTSMAYYYKDRISETIQYLKGKRDGYHRKYFPSGSMSYEAFYQSNRIIEIQKTWWINGNVRSEYHYTKDGERNGEQLEWYKSGALLKKRILVNGHEEGIQQSWRENGKLYNNYEAKNGRIFGLKRANLCYSLDDEIIQYANK